jgi:hypothetical protein
MTLLICCLIVERYLSVIVLPVLSNMTLMISLSAIRLMVRAATIDFINSLSLWGNLDVLLCSPLRKIKFRASSMNAYLVYSIGCCHVRRTKDMF